MSNQTGRTLAAGLLAGALLAGCAHKPTLVGTWSGTTTTSQGSTLKTQIQFAEDGKETMTLSASGGPIPAPMSGSGNGTYTVDGSKLTQNIASFTMAGRTIPIPQSVTQYKLDGDTLTLTKMGSPTPVVLTREKS